MSLTWEPTAKQKFDQMLEKVPSVLRSTAESQVLKKAEMLLTKANRNQITEKDLVDAFFAATPFGFHGPMKTDMLALGIDYTKYGYEK